MKLRTMIVTGLTLALVAPTVAGARTPVLRTADATQSGVATGANAKANVTALQRQLRKAEGRVATLDRRLRDAKAGTEWLRAGLRAAKRHVVELRIELLFAKDDLARMRQATQTPPAGSGTTTGTSTGIGVATGTGAGTGSSPSPSREDCVSTYGECTDEQLCVTWGEGCHLVAPLPAAIAAPVEPIVETPAERPGSGEVILPADPHGYDSEC